MGENEDNSKLNQAQSYPEVVQIDDLNKVYKIILSSKEKDIVTLSQIALEIMGSIKPNDKSREYIS